MTQNYFQSNIYALKYIQETFSGTQNNLNNLLIVDDYTLNLGGRYFLTLDIAKLLHECNSLTSYD